MRLVELNSICILLMHVNHAKGGPRSAQANCVQRYVDHFGPFARDKCCKAKDAGGDCIWQKVEEHHEKDVIIEEAFLFGQGLTLVNFQPTTISDMEIPVVNEPA